MKFFTLINGEQVHLAPDQKLVPADEFSSLMTARELLQKLEEDTKIFQEKVASESEQLKENATKEGFDAGLLKWTEQIKFLEEETKKIRDEMESAIVPLALAAVKKIIGKEIELRSETIVDIVANALKSVSQHHRITIYVSRADLEIVEANRPRLKAIFEHLQTLTIAARDDVGVGGCIIETEVGIINARLDHQLMALEQAFHKLLHNHKGSE